MRTFKSFLTLIALLLWSFSANATVFTDWVSNVAGTNNGVSSQTYTINANAGDVLTFDWLVSSEPNYDWLIVTLNGTEILKKSGVTSGTYSHTFSSSGSNTLIVKYTKDGSVNKNDDYAKVYNINVSQQSPTVIASGTHSSNLTWQVTSHGVLTIEGTGDMANCNSSSDYPWYEYIPSITSIVIGEGVTSIGKRAFNSYQRNSKLTNLSIASTVKTIGEYAFDTCDKLTTLTIPEGCTTIENAAFLYCMGLTTVTLPKSLTYIGEHAFANCYKLEAITIPENVSFIGRIPFRSCSKLTSMVVDANNKVYDSRNNCNAIIETANNKLIQGCDISVIPESITEIGEDAFYACSELESIVIPNSVTSIGESAFMSCTSLREVNIPNSVISIGRNAFLQTTNSLFTEHDGIDYIDNWCFGNANPKGQLSFKEGTIGIVPDAFENCNNITSIIIPKSVVSIGDGAFSGCSGCTSITIDEDNQYYDSREDCNAIIETANNKLIQGCQNTTIPSSVEAIGVAAFSYCSGLTNIEIPNSVTSIGNSAFFGCSSLTSIEIPNSVTNIGYQAFSDCTGLTNIEIPNSVTNIGYQAFSDCTGLTNIEIPNGVTSLGNYAFSRCSNLVSITIPESLTSIGYNAFYGCNLLSVTLNCKNVENWFSGITSIETITLGEQVTSIGNEAFANCTGLKSITIPSSVTSISNNAFNGCESLSVTLNWENIGSLLSGNKSIETVILSDQVKSIGNYAFSGCSKLTSITIPNSVTDIGGNAFSNCSNLTSIIIPNNITSIKSGTFSGCSNLSSITIPNSVTSIAKNALYNTLWYENQPNGVVYAGNILYDYKGEMPENTSIVVKDGTTAINEEVFYCKRNLIDISFPTSLKSIGPLAFANTGLTNVVFSEGLLSIGEHAFQENECLEHVYIPKSVQSLGSDYMQTPFAVCPKLTSIQVHPENPYFDSRNNCNAIIETSSNKLVSGCKTTVIPSDIETIGGNAFFHCNWPNDEGIDLIFPAGLKFIEQGALNFTNFASITCKASTPPVFEGSYLSNYGIPVYVPALSIESYKSADGWSDFTNILAIPTKEYNLVDGVDYTNSSMVQDANITYTRTLPNLLWNALYVPFEISVEDIADKYEVAYINGMHSYDKDDNGEIDDLQMEVIKIKGGTLKANYPYMIKARNEAARTMNITLEDATLYAAEENTIDCSSVYQKYEISGTYHRIPAAELNGALAISVKGAWQPISSTSSLKSFRLYLNITNRDDSPLKVDPQALSQIRIIEKGETTDIESITPTPRGEDVIYDLSGRRVKNPGKGIYIVNGKKVML